MPDRYAGNMNIRLSVLSTAATKVKPVNLYGF
jgi:hypothetical protein